MWIAGKVVSILVIGIMVVLGFDGYFSIRRDIALFDTGMRRDARLLGDGMRRLLADVWESRGQDRAMEVVELVNAGEHRLEVRWVWLDGASETRYRPHVPAKRLAFVKDGETLSIEWVDPSHERFLCTYVPVTIGQRRGALEMSESFDRRENHVRRSLLKLAILFFVLLLSGTGLAVVVGVSFVGRPLAMLVDKTREVGEGNLSPPKLQLPGEFGRVATAFDEMCTKLSAARDAREAETAAKVAAIEQLRHADRLVTVGQLASGVAHELGTPLNVVLGLAAQLSSGDFPSAQVKENARIIKTQTERMTSIIHQLLDFSRRRTPNRAVVALPVVVSEALRVLSPEARQRGATLSLSEGPELDVMIDAAQIQQVVSNLVVNAIQAMSEGGDVRVSVEEVPVSRPERPGAAPGNYACISVEDEGGGIAADDLPHIFDPFFTTKEVGAGTGLGLSISYGIVQEHGGWISVETTPGAGSTFRVFLPMEPDA